MADQKITREELIEQLAICNSEDLRIAYRNISGKHVKRFSSRSDGIDRILKAIDTMGIDWLEFCEKELGAGIENIRGEVIAYEDSSTRRQFVLPEPTMAAILDDVKAQLHRPPNSNVVVEGAGDIAVQIFCKITDELNHSVGPLGLREYLEIHYPEIMS